MFLWLISGVWFFDDHPSISNSTLFVGDRGNFDSRGHVLAHGYYSESGWIHYDDDTNWADGSEGAADNIYRQGKDIRLLFAPGAATTISLPWLSMRLVILWSYTMLTIEAPSCSSNSTSE